MKKLSPRQEAYCREIASGRHKNNASAARAARYLNPKVASCRLMKHDHINDRIAELQRESINRFEIDTDNMIDELITVAEQPSIAEYLTQTPAGDLIFKELSELSPEQLAAVRKTPIRDLEGWSNVELHDKAVAVAKLLDLAAPQLTQQQRAAIVFALTRLGSQRGFTLSEMDILTNALTVPQWTPQQGAEAA